MADESTAWQRHGGQQHAVPSTDEHRLNPDSTPDASAPFDPLTSYEPSGYQRVGRRAAHQAQMASEPDVTYQRNRRSNRTAPEPVEAAPPPDHAYQRTGRKAANAGQTAPTPKKPASRTSAFVPKPDAPAPSESRKPIASPPKESPPHASTFAPKPDAPAPSEPRKSIAAPPKDPPRASAFAPKPKPESAAPEPMQRRHKERVYDYVPYRYKKRQRAVLMAALACLLVFNLVKLGGYISDYASSRRTSDDLRAAYYEALSEEETPVPSVSPTAVPVTPTPTAVPALAMDETPEPEPTATPRVMLEKQSYPTNPYAVVSSRFQKMQRQNSDIVGWLTVPGLLDEAVVQKDNSYYLRRDYRGYHNDNGSIFLEESCDLSTRPYTLMLFGHNMKSGAMFGCLRNYENIHFYRNNPFITFDTAYEDGRYVIFAIGTLSQNRLSSNYLDIGMLNSLNVEWRETAITQLKKISEISTGISVEADDQLLLMITCVEADTERRIVAARRIRDGESEDSLQRLATYSITK